MMLRLTSAARKKLTHYTTTHACHLVFGVTSGGCAGFEYTWDKITTLDTVDPAYAQERIHLDNEYHVDVCPKSVLFVAGTTIDYAETMFGHTFTYDNPNAASSCGCNISFSPQV